jgi:hypothetical protein
MNSHTAAAMYFLHMILQRTSLKRANLTICDIRDFKYLGSIGTRTFATQ